MITLSPAAIALNRFGLGAKPNEPIPADPKQWLLKQFEQYQANPSAWSSQQNTLSLLGDMADNQASMRNADEAAKKEAKRSFKDAIKDDLQASVQARTLSALTTPTPFIERLVHFWANHFAISIDKPVVAQFAGAYELEAIRPHVLGSFREMLFAVEQHPAMLLYLDQAKSIGPNSRAASKLAQRDPDKQHGLNENLAREILELHTLGVRSGYTQTDVTEFAKALTGWSIALKQPSRENQSHDNQSQANQNQYHQRRAKQKQDNDATVMGNGFMFRPALHEPGARNVLGKTYAQEGLSQASSILDTLASAPATAQHIAYKLARHFVSDTPSQSLVDQLAATFLKENGQLTAVYRVLINATEAWNPAPAKFKTPWEWFISSLRGTGKQSVDNMKIIQIMNQLGQPVWKPGSPAGFDDMAEAWAAPDALLRRVEFAQRIANPLGNQLDARHLIDQLLAGSASAATKQTISRAESASTGLALLLVSPDFLRR